MAQMYTEPMCFSHEERRGEAAFPTCQALKLNWARNTPWFLLLEDRSQLSLSICGTQKGRVEFCGLEALRRFFSLCANYVHGIWFFCLSHHVGTSGPGADILSTA